MRTDKQAVNSVIQGTAADVVKLAMVQVDKLLQERYPTARLLLQIHDELIFEVEEEMVDEIVPLIVKTMESVIQLSVAIPVRM